MHSRASRSAEDSSGESVWVTTSRTEHQRHSNPDAELIVIVSFAADFLRKKVAIFGEISRRRATILAGAVVQKWVQLVVEG